MIAYTALRTQITLVCIFLFVISACRHDEVSSDTRDNRYRHALYGSEEECRRLNPNPEIGCYQTVVFRQNNEVSVMIESDVLVNSKYKRNNDTITVHATPGIRREIIFYVKSDDVIINISDHSEWQRY